jgi:hypothetical protein
VVASVKVLEWKQASVRRVESLAEAREKGQAWHRRHCIGDPEDETAKPQMKNSKSCSAERGRGCSTDFGDQTSKDQAEWHRGDAVHVPVVCRVCLRAVAAAARLAFRCLASSWAGKEAVSTKARRPLSYSSKRILVLPKSPLIPRSSRRKAGLPRYSWGSR